MSSQAQPSRQLFFVYAPDKTDDGTFERRLSVRPQHLEVAKARTGQGLIRLGGGLESIATPDAPKKLIGSSFIFQADSLEEVKKLIEDDIYFKSGVWDPEKLLMAEPSASPPKLQTFFVYAPDAKGEGALDRRYSVRPEHLQAMAPLISSKTIRFGGILLDPESQPTETDPRLRIIGSTMIIEAESIEKVKEIISSDVYYKSGVWDLESLVIVPFIPATPLP